MVNLSNLTKNGKMYMLAYDQGMEHGPVDFNLYNSDPENILRLALEGGATCVALQKGVAEKYYTNTSYATKIPLVLKLNGKTSFIKDSPYSPLLASVDEALELGATAIGYTVYIGSPRQDEMFREFSWLVREAHKVNIPVIGWMYPRSKEILEENIQITSYAARVGLELGADIVKVKSHSDLEGMKWVINCAGKCRVAIQGGDKKEKQEFLNDVSIGLEAGAIGVAVGRNIWQSENPLEVSKDLEQTIFGQ